MIKEISRNCHMVKLNSKSRRFSVDVAHLSDLHWDNPDCDRVLLKKHLDQAKENGWRVFLNGDTFCLMQGKYDPRSNKDKIRPEHNVHNYLDAVIDDAAEWFAPYAEIIDVVGYGNHCTSIIKRMETDPLERFVERLNAIAKPKEKVHKGGYGGWYIIHATRGSNNSGVSYKTKYFHGSGGGGVVTKGMINLTRAAERHEGHDCFTMGHVHENIENYRVVDALDHQNQPIKKEQLYMITGTYKDEYKDGAFGWHVERGAPDKPLGGRLLTIDFHFKSDGTITKNATSRKLS